MRLNIILFKNMHTTIGKNVKHAKEKFIFELVIMRFKFVSCLVIFRTIK